VNRVAEGDRKPIDRLTQISDYGSYDRAPPPHFRIAHRIRKKATTNGDNQKSAAAMRVSHPPCSSVANMSGFYAQIIVVGEIA
jgi:hypothetical protein